MGIFSMLRNIKVTFAETEQFTKDRYPVIMGNGVTQVTKDTAMTLSAYYSGVRNIAETISTMPIRVKTLKGKQFETNPGHPLNTLVSLRPSYKYGKIDFMQAFVSNAVSNGNGYARIYRNNKNRPIELCLLSCEQVKPFLNEGFLYYAYWKVENIGKMNPDEILQPEQILHLKGQTFNGIEGMSPIKYHSKTIGLGLAANDFANSFFSNGANMAGVLQHPSKLDKGAVDRLKDQFAEKYAGNNNANSTVVLEEGMQYQRISIQPNDAQMIETKKYNVEDIARILRMPLNKLQSDAQTSYNSQEQENINFVVDCLRPWTKKVEEEFTLKLFRDSEQVKNRFKIDMNSLLRGDTRTRVEAQWKWFQMGAKSPNEIRADEGLPPRPDGKGNDYYVPVNIENQSNPPTDGENK